MKTAAYEKVGLEEYVEYANPQRWTPCNVDFRIDAFGVREVMPPLIVDRPSGTGGYLFILFHDSASVWKDGEPNRLDPGSLMLWPRGSAHRYGNEEKEWSHTWIHFNGAWGEKHLTECGIEPGAVQRLNKMSAMEDALWRMYEELTTHQKPDPVILKNLFHNWIRELMRDAEEGAARHVPEKIRQVKQYLDQHAQSRITLRGLSEKSGMSIPYLSAEFKRHYNDSPINYLIGAKLRQARKLLLNQNLQISEIARCVGYEDIFHFSKLFKKHFGLSPRAMRNSQLNHNT